MEEEELPQSSMTRNFSPAPMRRVRRPSLSSSSEPKPLLADDDFDDEEEKVRYKRCSCSMWVVTFGDLMSLLLTFFVLILSFSTMDPVKFKVVRGSLDTALGIKISASNMPRRQHDATEFSRRDFNKQIESILKKSFARHSARQDKGREARPEKVNDIRGEVVRFMYTICSYREVR